MVGKIKPVGLQFAAFNGGLPFPEQAVQNPAVAPQDVVYIPYVVIGIAVLPIVKLIAAAIITKQLIRTAVKGAATFLAKAFENRFHKKYNIIK
jgi:hypothetical protein